ncbi:hypothetical protein [Candidatus Methanoperedens nitratireducens]|uniref:Uncharacterized protein n=1 Tax=Candidatus Methanoperedens nitratireducens TaxID=1392998 RepID=A0A284VMF0_9EURY|nr:hypothetical protein [Candidatus Methanoperedens nitroreducens]SNQ60389.1 hypothetical protein MNV_180021 [Candidatus Methanoperedens nitroreducens]
MTEEDIHNHLKALENTEKYISKLLPEDRENVKRFIKDAWAKGYSKSSHHQLEPDI